jgi:ATP-binding protein involved in chromosome partitioning
MIGLSAPAMTTLDEIRAAIAAIAGDRAAPARFADGRVTVVIDATGWAPAKGEAVEAAIRAALVDRPEIIEVRVALTAEKIDRRVIAVGSGKGGVGKSTFAANLAIALAAAGRRVGLVDADIYGPSQPRIMGVEGSRAVAEDKRLIPVETRYGVPMLSMGQLVKAGQAIAWRGPMAAGALGQLLDADWGETDLLVADLPPGTGDVQLSMIAKHRPAGALIVSTPQDLALIDATRAIDLFVQAGVPIIGLVENMAGYICPHCGKASDPFGHGGAEDAATRLGIPFLGRVPLDIAIRLASDAGEPPAAVAGGPGEQFHQIAASVSDWLNRNG